MRFRSSTSITPPSSRHKARRRGDGGVATSWMRAPWLWQLGIIVPFSVLSGIELPEHIMRAPVAGKVAVR